MYTHICVDTPLHVQLAHYTHCNELKYTATHCNTLQHTAPLCNTLQRTLQHTLQQKGCPPLDVQLAHDGLLLNFD